MNVLISAFSCGAGRGSEPGVGWNFAAAMARYHEVTILTTHEFQDLNDAAIEREGNASLRIEYYDLPWGLDKLRRAGIGMQIYYYLWQAFGVRQVARLHSRYRFDLAHHITFIRVWSPSILRNLDIPFVWGPVGGAERTPKGFSHRFGVANRIKEFLKEAVLVLSFLDPLVRKTARSCAVALATTTDSLSSLERRGVRQVLLKGESALSETEIEQLEASAPNFGQAVRFICIGRLLHWKGFQLAIEGLASADLREGELWICGDGPYRKSLECLARSMGVSDRVVFWGMLDRQECMEKLKACHVLVHPSLHDSGGWVCLEAMASKHPVICLDHGGPGTQVNEFTGTKIMPNGYNSAVHEIADAMSRYAADVSLVVQHGNAGNRYVRDTLTWSVKALDLCAIYDEVVS